ncbi:MAG TPA: phage holin family protein [Solirubrobacteraceae bacterium]|nr:phage holin family protein [Solirubrobacteraceae bacterium]
MSSAAGSGGGPADPAGEGAQGIVTAIADISERASLLVREEIELAKAEMAQKATRLAKGAVVGVAAGIFFVTALFFVLIGLAWLLYYYLPIGNDYTYFWGFFAMALILVILGVIAGLIAAKAVKRGAPTPDMAIEEARLIRETMAGGTPEVAVPAAGAAAYAGSGPGTPGGAPAGVGPAAHPSFSAAGPETQAGPGAAPYGAAAAQGAPASGEATSGETASGETEAGN